MKNIQLDDQQIHVILDALQHLERNIREREGLIKRTAPDYGTTNLIQQLTFIRDYYADIDQLKEKLGTELIKRV